MPPCAGTPYPAAGDVGAPLNQIVWMDEDMPDDWSPAPCTGWVAGPTSVLLAAAGRFRLQGDSTAIAAKLGRISMLTGMIYWSTTRGRWRNLFREAVALSRPERAAERLDFSADELVSGSEVFYRVEEANPTAGVIYRMRIHSRTPDRIVFEMINETALRARVVFVQPEVAEPGEFRQLYFLERDSGDIWRYYSLVRLGRAGWLAGTSADNYRNRAAAYFRYLAGLDMAREPPAAP